MAFEDFRSKASVVIVYSGEGKGKTTASIGLLARALGNRSKVAFIQFIKAWGVSEHVFLRDIQSIYPNLHVFKGGKGFYKAGELSEAAVSEEDHQKAANQTYLEAKRCICQSDYDLVICDEINNAVNDGLLSKNALEYLLKNRRPQTSLCLTGRNFPKDLLKYVDIATDMVKIKHHFDDKYLANKGIDY